MQTVCITPANARTRGTAAGFDDNRSLGFCGFRSGATASDESAAEASAAAILSKFYDASPKHASGEAGEDGDRVPAVKW